MNKKVDTKVPSWTSKPGTYLIPKWKTPCATGETLCADLSFKILCARGGEPCVEGGQPHTRCTQDFIFRGLPYTSIDAYAHTFLHEFGFS